MVPKFRGKSKLSLNKLYEIGVSYNGDGFVTGNLIQDGKDSYIVNGVVEVNDECMAIEQCVPVFTDTVMQSTGLKDKNGVEIFEGDILVNQYGNVGYVAYLQQEAGFVVVKKKSDYRLGHRNTGESYDVTTNHEVIGNIHSNPELLDKSNEN